VARHFTASGDFVATRRHNSTVATKLFFFAESMVNRSMTAVKLLIRRAHTQAIGLLNAKTVTRESRARIQNANRNQRGSPAHDQYIPQRRHPPISFQLRYGCREIPHAKPEWLYLEDQIGRGSMWRSVMDDTPSVGYDRNWNLTENVWHRVFAVCRSTLLWLLRLLSGIRLLLKAVRCLLCQLLEAFPHCLIKPVTRVAYFTCFTGDFVFDALDVCVVALFGGCLARRAVRSARRPLKIS